jgi:hypothetical protein
LNGSVWHCGRRKKNGLGSWAAIRKALRMSIRSDHSRGLTQGGDEISPKVDLGANQIKIDSLGELHPVWTDYGVLEPNMRVIYKQHEFRFLLSAPLKDRRRIWSHLPISFPFSSAVLSLTSPVLLTQISMLNAQRNRFLFSRVGRAQPFLTYTPNLCGGHTEKAESQLRMR